jgi:hypothetical protein
VRQQQILRDSRHGNGQGGSPLLQTPPCDLPLPPCDLPPTLLQSGSREVCTAACAACTACTACTTLCAARTASTALGSLVCRSRALRA